MQARQIPMLSMPQVWRIKKRQRCTHAQVHPRSQILAPYTYGSSKQTNKWKHNPKEIIRRLWGWNHKLKKEKQWAEQPCDWAANQNWYHLSTTIFTC